ncbi:MAG TPA: erythromycin esterase family protein [Microvirga sp.]|jgi:erythromycin esterase-like protein
MVLHGLSRRQILRLGVSASATTLPIAALAQQVAADREDDQFVKVIDRAAEPLPSPGDPAFGAFFDRFGQATVVLLGEATHGTSEFYQARAEITKRLVRDHGFSILAVEADWPDANHIDAYIHSRERPSTPAQPFQRFPTWMWRNEETLALVDWLREHNATRPTGANQVGFYGLDLYSLGASLDAVTIHLATTDPAIAARAREHYSCIEPYRDEPADYGADTLRRGFRTCEKDVSAVLEMVAALPRGDSNFDALQNARVVAGAERYYRAAYAGAVSSWNLRDQHMFDTLLAVLQARGPGAKAIVWAHNSHVGNAAATELGRTGQYNIGQLCRQHFGDSARLIGFGTDRGTVMAASRWGAEPEVMPVRPSLQASYGALFRAASPDRFLLDLRRGVHEPLRAGLSRERLERAIGVMYLPETERVSHYFRSILPDEFDAFIWLEETRAVTPTPTSGRTGLPDGHPFGTHTPATGSVGLGQPARQ